MKTQHRSTQVLHLTSANDRAGAFDSAIIRSNGIARGIYRNIRQRRRLGTKCERITSRVPNKPPPLRHCSRFSYVFFLLLQNLPTTGALERRCQPDEIKLRTARVLPPSRPTKNAKILPKGNDKAQPQINNHHFTPIAATFTHQFNLPRKPVSLVCRLDVTISNRKMFTKVQSVTESMTTKPCITGCSTTTTN
jgi:hypothetical protein